MSKYKVGDVVVIRSDLYLSERYGKRGLICIGDMVKYRGVTREISEIYQEFFDGEDTWYRLTDTPYLWCDDMFEDLVENEPSITVVLPDTAEFNARLKTGAGFLDMFIYE